MMEPWLLAIAVMAAAAILSWLSLTRYLTFNAGHLDLGDIVQTLWNTGHGALFQQTALLVASQESHLAEHADFWLVPLSLPYRIWPSATWLLGLQAVAVACGAVPLWAIAKRLLAPGWSLIVPILYLAYPAMYWAVNFDFHTDTLAIPLMLLAAWAAIEERWKTYLAVGLVLVLAKEDVAAAVGGMGLFTTVVQRKPKIGLPMAVVGLGWAVLAVFWVVPHFHLGLGPPQSARYGYLGHGPVAILIGLFGHPQRWAPIVFSRPDAVYAVALLVPLGLLPLLDLRWWVPALPTLAANLLAAYPAQHTIYFQYTATMIPFLAIASIYGLVNLRRWVARLGWPKLARPSAWPALALAVALGATAQVIGGPVPGSVHSLPSEYRMGRSGAALEHAIGLIPPHLAVSATNAGGAYLANRRVLYLFPVGWRQSCAVLVDQGSALDSGPYAGPIGSALRQVEADPGFVRRYSQDGVSLLLRRSCGA